MESFQCPACPEVFTDQKLYQNHQSDHQKIYVCKDHPPCSQNFKRKEDLAWHTERGLQGVQFNCEDCGKTFKTPPNLLHHHGGSKVNTCPTTGQLGNQVKKRRNTRGFKDDRSLPKKRKAVTGESEDVLDSSLAAHSATTAVGL
jgi:uncharacterized C2H2 Zn-finger protein